MATSRSPSASWSNAGRRAARRCSSALCREYLHAGGRSSPELGPLLATGVQALEAATGLRCRDSRRPLLLAVRSGAAASMPGMLETILNVGPSDATVADLVRMTGNPHFAWDSYR